MKPNLIIRASAGTGKTFSLATRFIRLMLFNNVACARIVALTFSRAAAREICDKLVERLAKAAASAEGARREAQLLVAGLSEAERAALCRQKVDFSCGRFAALLRDTLEAQETGGIATLDSFILRIVRSFPLEMGFLKAVEVLDTFGEGMAARRVGEELLGGANPASAERDAAFRTAFQAAVNGSFTRTCQVPFDKILRTWLGFVREHPEERAWTRESVFAALNLPLDLTKPSLSGCRATGNNARCFEGFRDHLADFDGRGALFPKNKTGEMMRFFVTHEQETCWTYDTEGARAIHRVCDVGPEGAKAVRDGVAWMVWKAIGFHAEAALAKRALCRLFEAVYDAATRRQGQLTFSDFTRCQAFSEDSAHPLELENIQYRFDERFDHWALDEFQDTSRMQWRCLKRLVEEAASDDARSVMVVGDLKQSIYGWRGGDDGPFREVMEEMPAFRGDRGESLKNDVSYRYGPHTVRFINRVFGPENLARSPILAGRCADATAYWLGENCWMTHRADCDAAGRPKAEDYVEIVRVAKEALSGETQEGLDEESSAGASAAMRILAPKIALLVRELWQRHENGASGRASTDTIGILVRTNADGACLAECIRSLPACDIPVVWEGANGLLDVPAVRATLALLTLAIHPEDTFAWTLVNRLSPMRELLFPACGDCASVSRLFSARLARFGLSRTLREIAAALGRPEAGLSARSKTALEYLVRQAVAFESRASESGDVSDFPAFLAAAPERESGATPRVVRILTIHRAKGLTLDHVIVPILESGARDSILKPDARKVLEGAGWAMEMPPEDIALSHPVLAAAWRKEADAHFMEILRLNYVALTRARKSTYVFVIREDARANVQFRDLLLAPFSDAKALAGEGRAYGEVVFSEGTPFSFGCEDREEKAFAAWEHRPGRAVVARRTPSAAGSAVAAARGAKSMATFFSRDFGRAAQHGIDLHARYAKIAWLSEAEAAALPGAFRAAFVKPAPGATLWRERRYEIFSGDTWETGQFDRVVFAGEGLARTAWIYDFKTNRRRPDEDAARFARRMTDLYRPQMTAYRKALAILTGLAPDRIRAVLLLEDTSQAVDV